MKRIQSYLPLMLIAAAAIFLWLRYKTIPTLEPSSIQLAGVDGKTFSLADTLHSKSIIHFYASWCGPCMKELKQLSALQTELSEYGWHLILITDDDVQNMQLIAKRYQLSCTLVRVSSMKELGVYSIPATVVLNDSGQEIFSRIGEVHWMKERIDEDSFLRTPK